MDFGTAKRSTFWSVVVGQTFQWLGLFTSQTSVQRFSSLETERSAKIALLVNGPLLVLLGSLACFTGTVAYAYYAHKGCDPIKAGLISNPNQILPYFVLEVLNYQGMAGLFTSCLFSGSLSTMSSLLSSTAANIWEDILKQNFSHLHEHQRAVGVKVLVGVCGILALACAFLAKTIGGTLTLIIVSFVGAALGPMLGMISLAAFFPCVGWKGPSVGAVVGLALTMWISIGAITDSTRQKPLPTNTTSCGQVANSFLVNSTQNSIYSVNSSDASQDTADNGSPLHALYSISYLWYCAIGMCVTVLFGLISSIFPGCKQKRKVDDTLLSPLACCRGPVCHTPMRPFIMRTRPRDPCQRSHRNDVDCKMTKYHIQNEERIEDDVTNYTTENTPL